MLFAVVIILVSALYGYTVLANHRRAGDLEQRLAALDGLLAGGTAAGGLARLGALEAGLQAAQETLRRAEQRISELERVARDEVPRLGFLRYNAFSDTGAELSFALALLNAGGDGVVLNSVFSREEVRTFGRDVRAFRTAQEASEEEQSVIAIVRNRLG
jgi:hypothetical protein